MGPMGFGPMTGRGAGFCAGYPVPGNLNPGMGRGFGGGRGGGRGGGFRHRHWFYATGQTGWQRAGMGGAGYQQSLPYAPEMTKDQELEILKNQAENLEQSLEQVKNRIKQVESSD